MTIILHQLLDFCADFLQTSIEKILQEEASYAEISRYTMEFSQAFYAILLMAVMNCVEEKIHEQIKATNRYHVIDKNRKRTLVTPCGEIELKRHYYKDKETGKSIFWLDKILKIPANDRIDPFCKALLVEMSADMSYDKVAKIVTGGRISGQSVCNAVREVGIIPETAAEMPKTNRNATRVYVEADEDHVSVRHRSAKQLKDIIVYEEKKTVSKGRRRLSQKRVFTGYDSPTEMWEKVREYLEDAYEPGVQITIIGDGAAWIKKGLEVIPSSDFALDLFHLSKYARKVTGNRSIAGIYAAIRANDKEWFKEKVRKELLEHPEREIAINEGARYILNQWKGARKSLEDESISSSTEAHVSHTLSDRMSTRPMVWGEYNSEIMGSIRAYKENGGNLQEYLLETFQLEWEVEKENKETKKMLQEGLDRNHERRIRRLHNVRLGIRLGHMPGSELARNSWMRRIINGTTV